MWRVGGGGAASRGVVPSRTLIHAAAKLSSSGEQREQREQRPSPLLRSVTHSSFPPPSLLLVPLQTPNHRLPRANNHHHPISESPGRSAGELIIHAGPQGGRP